MRTTPAQLHPTVQIVAEIAPGIQPAIPDLSHRTYLHRQEIWLLKIMEDPSTPIRDALDASRQLTEIRRDKPKYRTERNSTRKKAQAKPIKAGILGTED